MNAMCPEEIDLMRKSYDLHGVKYSIYQGDNRFNGTPVPEGYFAIYQEDYPFPASLVLKKLGEKNET